MRRAIGYGAVLAAVVVIGATGFSRLWADAGDYLSLSFSSYWASPVVLVQFAIEQDLAPTGPFLAAGQVALAGGAGALDKVILDVFGFSRGAAAARYFVNAVRAGSMRYDPWGPGDTAGISS